MDDPAMTDLLTRAVALVLDNTGSMCEPSNSPCPNAGSTTKIYSLKAATQQMLSILQAAALNPGDATDYGFVIAKVTIAVQFIKLGKDAGNVVQGVGAPWVTRYFDNLPGTEVGIDFFRELGALGPQVLNLRADIDLVISADQPQLLDLDLQLGNGLLKVKVIRIHAWASRRIGVAHSVQN